MKDQGSPPERASVIISGMHCGLTSEQLKYIASEKFDDAQASVIAKALSPKNVRPWDSEPYIHPERVMELADMGFSAKQLEYIYERAYGAYSDPVNEAPIYCHKEYSVDRMNVMWNSIHNDFSSVRRTVRFVDRYAQMPFSDWQLMQVLDIRNNNERIIYRAKSTPVDILPLSRAAHESFLNSDWQKWAKAGLTYSEYAEKVYNEWSPLTEEQISIYADPEIPRELMSIMRLALHAGIPAEQVAQWKAGGISAEKAHDEAMEYFSERGVKSE